MISFNAKYLFLTIIIFLVEIAIAVFVKDTLIRPFVGDILVVVLVYCFVRIFVKVDYWKAALGAFIFACTIEILQYFDYVKLLGFEQNRVISVALGRTFELMDFVAYLVGFMLIILAEIFYKRHRND